MMRRLLRNLRWPIMDDHLGGIISLWAFMTMFLPKLHLPWWTPLTLIAAGAAAVGYAAFAARRCGGGHASSSPPQNTHALSITLHGQLGDAGRLLARGHG
jgi:hypothetical protein